MITAMMSGIVDQCAEDKCKCCAEKSVHFIRDASCQDKISSERTTSYVLAFPFCSYGIEGLTNPNNVSFISETIQGQP